MRDRRVLTTLVQAFDKGFYFGLVLICLTSMKRSVVISWTGQVQRREKVVAEREEETSKHFDRDEAYHYYFWQG